ncbi:SDR family NAD(P)-dependent oxidoreductase [Paenibacillus ehimensis]|uniref:SDR family NAD(P)-dependent oxidoreductase n=1 Tax=Paenibacillus ehimensis TaxID=79264 RepID=A0ABT8V4B9_9BACL|nr:SDR family NAD(P)-dependent oxidoreductase [Paenibacillus ehimensis]MDO3676283.1 SDR family NAD(P)-dependent oxidoreductase [Paenibacillus ehimensis]
MENTRHPDSVHEQLEQLDSVNRLLVKLMWAQLHGLGCFAPHFALNGGTKAFYSKWLQESLNILRNHRHLLPVNDVNADAETASSFIQEAWKEWDSQLPEWLAHRDLKAHVWLADKMVRHLPDILGGSRLATETMFPESSMELVEGVYKHNAIADYFNETLAKEAANYVQQQTQSAREIRILEIGAGTGGTSEVVFQYLEPLQQSVREYCYTDISKAFLMHAEQTYGSRVPYLVYKIADLSFPFTEQGLEAGAYDLVIASNVLHTTRDIRHTLRIVKTVMKKNGLLLLNEITDKTVINHLTFGLLEGWWQYEDKRLRVPGSPALSAESWRKALQREGFHSIVYPAIEAAPYKQQIIAAKSDGVVIQSVTSGGKTPEASSPIAPQRDYADVNKSLSSAAHLDAEAAFDRTAAVYEEQTSGMAPAPIVVTDQMAEEYVRSAIRESIAGDLKIDEGRIQNDRSFSEYGIDSIIAVHLVNLINKKCGLTLQTTVVFDYNNVDQLVQHIIREHHSTIKTLLHSVKAEVFRTEPAVAGPGAALEAASSGERHSVTAVPFERERKAAPERRDAPGSAAASTLGRHEVGMFHRAVIEGPSADCDVQIRQAEAPALREDEVRIAVRAFSLNFGDLLCVKGLYPTMPPYPFTPGFEAGGIVVETGTAVTSVHCGDEVIFYAGESMGGHASAITCHESQVFPKPRGLSFEEACSLPVVAMTAIAAFRRAGINKGERVLIQTAAGGVGLIAVQLAKHYGAVIYATAGKQAKLEHLRQMGVDYAINYVESDFEQEIKRLTKGEGVDVILNTLAGEALQKGLNCLSRGGRYIEIAMTALKNAKTVDLSGLNHNQSFYSIDLRKLGFENPELLLSYRNEMLRLIEEGVIRPHVGKVFPFDQLHDAYRFMERREHIGKIAVTIPEPFRFPSASASVISMASVSSAPSVSAGSATFGSSRPAQMNTKEPVAIVGMSGRFARSDHVDELWEHLEKGADLIQEVSRWDLSKYYSDGSGYCNYGSFLEDISAFDPLFFNISGQEASYMDPQQRIFLEESWKALEDAGYAGAGMQGRRCGIYVGCTGTDYRHIPGDNPPPQSFWGKAGSIIPARIAYYLDLHGPAIAVDTACSSSLAAVHLACQALWSNEIDMALAGGVFIQSTPQFYIDSNRAGMLSLRGRCHTFDDRADGFVPGEGAGAIVLKRLKDALADGDQIYGVIRGTGMNQDGATNGITAPSAKSQTRLEQEVYDTFRIDPADIQLVEAHGTGTKLGDPIEFQALTSAFARYTNKTAYCAIGSIKTNLGHLATAAGIAGLIKILLSLKNKRIPASLHMQNGNPNIAFEGSPFYVNTTTKDWEAEEGKPRLAAISSFGFSGTNVHMVIEEAPQPDRRKRDPQPGYLIALSARTEHQLRQQAVLLAEHCTRQSADCGDMSYTLLTGRQHLGHRLACIVRSREELAAHLNSWLEKGKAPQLYTSAVNRNELREQAALKRYADECIRKCSQADSAIDYLENLSAVAELFIQGYEMRFEELFPAGAYRRISLPTYPFARESYWVPPSGDSGNDVRAEREADRTDRLHPLLHVNMSDLSEQRYSSFFTGEEFFLADHIVQGQKVLPGVAHLEWARAAVEHAAGGVDEAHMIQLKNIVWTTPLAVSEADVPVHIGVYPAENGDLAFEIYRETDDAGERLIYSQGVAIISERKEVPQVDIPALRAECSPSQVTAEAFYDVTREAGIAIGDRLRGIETVFLGREIVLAKLSLPPCISIAEGKDVLHPSMMDSALQAAIGYLVGTAVHQAEARKPVLPFALHHLQAYRPCTAGMWAIARYSEGRSAADKVDKLDIDLCDEDGNVCVRMTGFTPRTLERSALQDGGEAGQTVVLVPEWREKEADKEAVEQCYDRHFVMLSDPFAHWADRIRAGIRDVDCTAMRADSLDGATSGSGPNLIARRYLGASVQMLEVIQQAIRSGSKERMLIQVVVPNHGQDRLLTGLSGLLQTASQEHPWLHGQVIETGVDEEASALIAKLTENRNGVLDRLIRYENGKRYVRAWKETEASAAPPAVPWKDKGNYFISGGLGGLGFIFAREIAHQVKGATIILNGRSPLDAEQQAKLRSLEIGGNRIHYRAADLSDRQAVSLLMQEIQSDFGGLNGIIHSAGLTNDRMLLQKSAEEMQEVFAPKVDGTVLLDEASAAMKLDFFMLFSSLAGVLGNPGQGDYAAANAFMDEFARHRNEQVAARERSGYTVALNWPLWKDGGMKVSGPAEKMMRRQLGMVPMETGEGMRLFRQAITSGSSQAAVFHGQMERLKSKLMPGGPAMPVAMRERADANDGNHSQRINAAGTLVRPLSVKVQEALIQTVSRMLKVNRSDLYPDVEFGEYGFDSISFTEFANRLNEQYKLELTPTVFFEHSTIRALADYLAASHEQELSRVFTFSAAKQHALVHDGAEETTGKSGADSDSRSIGRRDVTAGRPRFRAAHNDAARAQEQAAAEPIAVIGMSGKFPMADNVNELWTNLKEGKDCISEIPSDRWNWRAYFGDPEQEANKTNIKWGGFMDGVADFDPMFFGISPREADLMDPQQRLLMMYVWKAIEDAGYSPQSLSGSRMGLFVGTASSGYNGLFSGANNVIEGYSSTGHVSSVGPNRMSYFLNVNGPSEPVETACSSSLVALHRAVQAIRGGDCDTAVVGGVNTILDPSYHISFNKAGMLSEDGRCKTFSDRVDGYVRGEGVGMIFLKKLRDAERDGDHIYGLVRGTGENHGGRAASLTAPNPRAQADLIKSVYAKAQIDPATVTYIEAHGTGTPLGDPIEINGLKTAFAELRQLPDARPGAVCGLGSIKTNIGHLELAAGIAGVIKVLLQLQHKTLVKTVHFDKLNPYIQLEGSPFYIVNENKEWPALRDSGGRELPRRAGISSFGFGGVNAHVLIEEYIPGSARDAEWRASPDSPALIVLSAKTEQRLLEQARQLLDDLQQRQYPDDQLGSIAYTLQVGRLEMEERLGLTVASIHELKDKLRGYIERKQDMEGVYRGQVKRNKEALSALAQDEDVQEAVQRWMRKKKFAKLLDLWVKGLHVDWSGLYEGRKPQRMSLPTYPFAKERYWAPHAGRSAAAGPLPPQTAILHPLLHRNTSTLSGQRFTSTFGGGEFFLADHVIRGRKTLPGVAYLEMARAAVEQAAESGMRKHVTVKLRDVVWASPLAVHEERGKENVQVHLGLYPEESGELRYEIYGLEGPEGEHAGLYNQGNAVLQEQREGGAIDITALLAECSHTTLGAEQCYRTLEEAGLNYGQGYRGIEYLHVGNNQALAQIALPTAVSSTANEYVLHPSLLDSAVQSCIGLQAFGRGAVVPFALDEMEIYGSCTPRMWAWVRPSKVTMSGSSVEKLDIDLCDEQGQLCLQMKGLAVLRTDEGSHGDGRSARTVNRQTGGKDSQTKAVAGLFSPQDTGALLQYPVWDAVPFERSALAPAPHDKTVFVGGTEEQLLAIRKLYPDVQTIRTDGLIDTEKLTTLLDRYGPIDHLIWSAPSAWDCALIDEQTLEQQQYGLNQLFRLIKSLTRLGYDTRELGMTVITNRTQSIHRSDPIQPVHAGIQGLVGALAKELPNWSIRHADVEGEADLPVHELFALPADPDGNTWAYRGREWYRQKLIAVQQAELPAKCYKEGGVYVVVGGAGGIGEVWSEYMLRTYNARLIWIGRRALDERIQAKLDRMAMIGLSPLYLSADASDYKSLQQAYDVIKRTYPAINGVIHSAVGVMDESLTHMTEERFRAGLSAKIDASVRMAQVFANEPLDFMMYFSSMSSFSKPHGQSGYAAGCTFVDAFAHETGRELPFPVKVINWGYWGDIGIAGMVPAAFKQRLIRSGIGFIEPDEAMQALEILLGSSLNRMAFIRTTMPNAVAGVYMDDVLCEVPRVEEVPAGNLRRRMSPPSSCVQQLKLEGSRFAQELDGMLLAIMGGQLQASGLLKDRAKLLGKYARWLDESKSVLARHRWTDRPSPSLDAVWSEWEERKRAWMQERNLKAQVQLADAMLRHLPDILTGKIPATDIMFPNSSMQLVEDVYKHNAVADYFNGILADTAAAYVEERLQRNPHAQIRILEAGAGTGGTSAIVLDKLKPYAGHIAEYAYTDLSRSFLLHGEQNYGAENHYLKCRVFDVEKSPAEQSLDIGGYDLVIAANVLHATRSIRRALRHVKALLKGNGLLLLNELTRSSLFSHLTFGLLEGWWRYEDERVRIPGSPVLDVERWRTVLEHAGFGSLLYPAASAASLGQQIIAAKSDGMVRLPVAATVSGMPDAADIEDAPAAGNHRGFSGQNGPEAEKKSLRKRSTLYFRQLVGEVVKIPYEQIDENEPLEAYGIDSILIVQLTNRLRKHFSDISSTLFFEYRTLAALIGYFMDRRKEELVALLGHGETEPAAAKQAERKQPASSWQRNDPAQRTWRQPLPRTSPQPLPDAGPACAPQPIAVIGMSGRYPQASNLEQFWNNLVQGKDCITEIPEERWPLADFYVPDRKTAVSQGKSYSKWGGFVDGFASFDPLFFNMSPREAIDTDPQERLFLQSVWEALEDAGYSAELFTRQHKGKAGVFAGITKTGFSLYGPGLWQQGSELFPTTSFGSVANRVSYLLNLHGPSMPVDTMCSSSLTAIHEACESLRSGACEAAIAGGVNLYLHPSNYVGLCAKRMLASDGKCKSFAQDADGFVPGEGVGVFILKLLSKAVQDRDPIHAVIRGTGINHGGKTNGYTVPNPAAQAELIRETMDKAGVHARSVSYIEAHGTGTSLGDPIEIAGLTQAFRKETSETGYCAIGSVKSNIGHLESAAGIAGLTKVILQMKHGTIAPSLHAQELNSEIRFDQTPFVVQQNAAEWKKPVIEIDGFRQEVPRIAGISSFGAGGANAHVIVEEYTAQHEAGSGAQPIGPGHPAVIVLSARNGDRLLARAEQLLAFIRRKEIKDTQLADLAYTLQVGREVMEDRLAFTAGSVEELVRKLEAIVANGAQNFPDDIYAGQVKRLSDALSLFASEEKMRETVLSALERKMYADLLQMWVKGVPVDWNKMYGDIKPRRIRLPAYPFAGETYWLTPADVKQSVPATEAEPLYGPLHPLLHRNTANLAEQRFTSTFTGQEFFLADHIVKGRKVLPGVAYLEMARAAVKQAAVEQPGGQNVISLRNIVWASPIRATSGETTVHIRLYEDDRNVIRYEIYTGDTAHDGSMETEVIHGQGRAVLQEEACGPLRIDLSAIRASCTRELHSEECYAAFAKIGLEYGAALQGIEVLYTGQDRVLARLSLPSAAADSPASYVLHPSLLDAALQSSIGLAIGAQSRSLHMDQPMVPYALEQADVLHPCASQMWAYIRYSENCGPQDRVQKLDFDVCDDEGRVCVRLKGFTSKRWTHDLSAVQAADENDTLLLVPEWQEQEEEVVPQLLFSSHIVMLCEPWSDSAMHERISAEMDTALCLRLNADNRQRVPGDESIERGFASAVSQAFGHIQRVLKARPEEPVLIQLLTAAQGQYELYSALSALLKTAELENPRVIVQIIEAEPGEEASALIRKLTQNKSSAGDTSIRYDRGKRYTETWKELGDAGGDTGSPKTAWKDGGIYLITGGMGGLGYATAQHIARCADGPTLIVTGRSPMDRTRERQLHQLESMGAKVVYRQSDVSDLEAVSDLMRDIRRQFGGLNGIIHSAGVIRDSFMIKKTLHDIDQVLAPKVAGTVYLDEASREFELDFFVLFSSLSGIVGNTGQADYAAANAFMDRYAKYRNALAAAGERHGHTLSINWPLWEEGGMQMDERARNKMKQLSGMTPLGRETGMKALDLALALRKPQVAVMHGDAGKIRSFMGLTGRAGLNAANADTSAQPDREAIWRELVEKVRSGECSLEQFTDPEELEKLLATLIQ